MLFIYFAVVKTGRSSSTLPGNFSVVRTPLPSPPPQTNSSKFSPEVEKYLLSPEVVELLRCKPNDSFLPPGTPFQDALVQKGLASHSRTLSYPNSSRTSTGSSIDSPITSQRSSQDPEYFSTRFSTSSAENHSDSVSFNYDIPNSNQPAGNSVPSHYDIPRSSLAMVSTSGSNRAQMLSNNYMVPRLARTSDPLCNYDYLPPPRPATAEGHYDYPPKRETSWVDVPLPPRSDMPLPPRLSDVGVPHSTSIYDIPPHPRPLQASVVNTTPPISSTVDMMECSFLPPVCSRRESIESTDCPTPLQGDLPPPPIIFRKDSKGGEEDMIPNRMYEMVWANEEQFAFVPDSSSAVPPVEDERQMELEETLTLQDSQPQKNRQYVNFCVMDEEEIPPPVDRSLKPGAPPKIDRNSKPKGPPLPVVAGDDVQTTLEKVVPPQEIPPNQCTTSNEEIFSPREIPRLTSHSVHYTQVSFDRKKPVPTPRSSSQHRTTPTSSPQRRVNYCHIDVNATNNSSQTDAAN